MKKILALLLALAMVFSLAACGNSSSEPSQSAGSDESYAAFADKYGEIEGLYPSIVIASRSDVQNLQPTAGTGAPKDEFYWNVYESLFTFDEEQNLYPALAKDYTPSEDGLYWDIRLFETIKDSNGNAITAEDVAASYKWLVDAGEALKFENVVSWEAVDNYTFRIHWAHAPTSPEDYEFPLCRTFVFDSQYQGTDFSTVPVGTGNYLVVDFVTGNHLTLWANPNYWGYNTDEDLTGRMSLFDAHVQMITYEIISESATAEVALEKGTVDFCSYISQTASIEKFKTQYADKYIVDDSQVGGSYFFMEPNMDSSTLIGSDENLRLAIFYGLTNDVISALMGTSYVPMKTLGHRGYGDFDTAWEEEENYTNVYDPELAKEYLEKSSYNGEDLAIICKSSEIEKNAAQSILSQLTSLGINCHITSIDNAIFTKETSDPANWDLILFEMGGASLISSLNLPLGNPNTSADGNDSWSLNFIRDKELLNLMEVAKADETHTPENVKKVIDYALENAYIYPIAYSFTCYIYTKDITNLYTREKTVTPSACTYAGQPIEAEKGVMIKHEAPAVEGTFDPALAGEYTYSEEPKFGNKDSEFWLTLNEDGTYKLVNNNGVGEEVFTEGNWIVVGEKTVYLSAAPVQGAMDRMLVDWVADFENPDPTFVLDTDTMTMVPVGAADAKPPMDDPKPDGEEAKPGGEEAKPGEYKYSENNGFIDLDWTLTLKDDGSYILNEISEFFDNSYTGSYTLKGDTVECGPMGDEQPGQWDWANPAGFSVVISGDTFTPVR